jgi:hypothetical protein
MTPLLAQQAIISKRDQNASAMPLPGSCGIPFDRVTDPIHLRRLLHDKAYCDWSASLREPGSCNRF